MKNQRDNNVLGKGLAALLSNNPKAIQKAANLDEPITTLEINSIEANPFQPRTVFAQAELNELKQSIKQYGVIQPIIVRKKGSGYQLVAGERRWQASKLAGLATIPVLVKEIDDKNLFEIAVIENIQRESLSALEEAIAYEKFVTEYGYTHETLANRIGKSRSYIANTLRLLALSPEIQDLLHTKVITAGHARAILNSKNKAGVLRQVIENGLSVRDTESIVKKERVGDDGFKESKKQTAQKDEELLKIEEMLSQATNLKISITNGQNGGQVAITFESLDQLDQIIQLLNGEELSF